MVRSKDGHRHPRDGPPPQSREGQSQRREVPLHYKESQVRSRARVPTDRLLAGGDEEEPDYASIESVDGSLQEVGVGEYRCLLIIAFSKNIQVAKTSPQRDFEVSPVSMKLLILELFSV